MHHSTYLRCCDSPKHGGFVAWENVLVVFYLLKLFAACISSVPFIVYVFFVKTGKFQLKISLLSHWWIQGTKLILTFWALGQVKAGTETLDFKGTYVGTSTFKTDSDLTFDIRLLQNTQTLRPRRRFYPKFRIKRGARPRFWS